MAPGDKLEMCLRFFPTGPGGGVSPGPDLPTRIDAMRSDDYDPFDDEPDIEPCHDCGHVYCVCNDPDHHCRACGRLSSCIDNGLCGMCFEMQGGVLLPGQ